MVFSLSGFLSDAPTVAAAAEAAVITAYMAKAGLTPRKDGEKLSASERHYLSGPLIAANLSWGETIPQWLRNAVKTARLGMVLAGEKELASEEEAVAYLYTAGLAAPLSHDWAMAYLVLSARVLARWGKLKSPAEFWEMTEMREPRLSSYQEMEINNLRRAIRRSVERHARR